MKILQTYASTFLLASCILITAPSHAMTVSNNPLTNFLASVQSSIENNYFAVSIGAIVAIGSYLGFKHFFGSNSAGKPNVKSVVISQEALGHTTKTIKPEQVIPVARQTPSVANNQKTAPIVKITNNHEQSLEFCVSSAENNNDLVHQFSIPSHSEGLIDLNQSN